MEMYGNHRTPDFVAENEVTRTVGSEAHAYK